MCKKIRLMPVTFSTEDALGNAACAVTIISNLNEASYGRL
jgi:hypothetical protein